ncbi:rRNA maturation RNase YbeY [Candidatus Shapirobacteria bacterium CG09_land_8_20_14_0_10_49_15]|uniref:rRNA maturation RNase YbeY n=1 Tax=Candidatus Shapirobacteria bacterium CG09_land_8_20_14_0_10_49_15 TaxID=1974482 RepID=A0A2M6XAK0_9BACT|nr:MAG: rRNA maturation RNase YbeY [Candidatus Shapirobacteria bacterium CG09_land_8_20_14_0_10_49_15]
MFSINVNFVDSRTMRRFNKKYRNLDKPTTVLTFYYGEDQVVKDTCLGEVFICLAQAKKQNLTVTKLIIHGFSNLLSQIPAAKLKST